MRVSTLWAIAVAALTITVFAGCAPSAAEPEPEPTPFSTAAPTAATSAPPPDDGGDEGRDEDGEAIAIELPHLPIGGPHAPDPADPARQCVDVNWITQGGEPIPGGIAITVTGAHFSPPIFDVVDGCAGSAPACLGHVFDAAALNCVLAVAGNGAVFVADQGTPPTVSLTGSAECDAPDSAECSAFVEGVQADPNVAISLEYPADGGTPTDDGTSIDETPTVEDAPEGETPTDDITPPDDGTGE
ncbi:MULTISPECIES: hypothetical protein [unclassified Leifsonia]|uniref:hypothetical protein n=1 Tax=unclassified Leifsonia TaxID=2663824 RepID=UPI000701488D|nr:MULTISPECIES: hypothetical protein [unclassified Leifsonia]KQX05188.1 hypothetical protein ASC59_13385 [Leifsonia sp. Root1293]KRA08821.1 hypothetical protein ASD61_13385 [Leifsonia sp. Root60]